MIDAVRSYLKTADLRTATMPDCALALGVNRHTLLVRLKRQGTTWLELKTAERRWRLNESLAQPGRPNVTRMAARCGFSGNESFLEFFKRAKGERFTDYRLARQR